MACSRRPSLPWTHRRDERLASKACMIKSSSVGVDGTVGCMEVVDTVTFIFAYRQHSILASGALCHGA
jgi:hypothetical protein